MLQYVESMPEDTIVMSSSRATVSIDLAAGGRIASLSVDGDELLYTGKPDASLMGWGCYPMAPFAGRIRNGVLTHGSESHQLRLNMSPHSIHGTVFDQHWKRDGDNRFICELGQEWPWEGYAVQIVDLYEDCLHLQLELHAAGEAFPANIGWHPWFRTVLETGEQLRLDASVGQQLLRDDSGMPTGRWVDPQTPPWDDCFTNITWPILLDWSGRRTLRIESSCDYVVIYNKQPHAWCVEPQSGPPDAVNNSAHLVTSDSPLIATTTWRW